MVLFFVNFLLGIYSAFCSLQIIILAPILAGEILELKKSVVYRQDADVVRCTAQMACLHILIIVFPAGPSSEQVRKPGKAQGGGQNFL